MDSKNVADELVGPHNAVVDVELVDIEDRLDIPVSFNQAARRSLKVVPGEFYLDEKVSEAQIDLAAISTTIR